MSTPALRFKDEAGQDFPEWQEKPFKDVSKINQGLQIPISDRFSEGGENRHFYITNEFLRKDAKNQYFIENPPSSVLCSETDVLMTRTGNTGKVVTNVKGAFHNNFFKIGYDKNILNKDFLCEFLCLEHTQSLILKLAGTSTIPDLNHSDFYKINIKYPSLPEQSKIANFHIAIDEKITQLTQKYDLLTQYIKSVMQQMFSQELCFKDDGGRDFPKWEERKLADLVEKIGSGGTPKSTNSKYYDGNIPWVSIADMTSSGKFILDTKRKITSLGLEESSARLYPSGVVLFAMYASIGEVAIAKLPVTTSQAILGIQPKNELILNEYLYFWLLSLKDKIVLMGQQGTQSNLNLDIVKKFIISVPSISEQTKIANFLSVLDDKITTTQTQLQAVKQYKQGLLQQMFV